MLIVGNDGIGACVGVGFADIVTGIGGSGCDCTRTVFDEDVRAGLADFAADPPRRTDRRVERRRVTIVK